jgi:hypothetical protein
MAHRPHYLAAAGHHHRRGVALEGMSEGIVGGDEKPGIPTLLHQCPAGRRRKAVGVEAPVHAVRRTGFSSEIRTGSAGVDVDGVVRARHLAHGEPDGRIGNVEDDVDALVFNPLPGDVGADIGLVLVVGEDDFDRPAQHLAAVILDRHARGVDRAHAGQIRIQSGLVVEDTELHRLLRDRGGGEPRSPQDERKRGGNVATHEILPLPWRPLKAGRVGAIVQGKTITAKRGLGSRAALCRKRASG